MSTLKDLRVMDLQVELLRRGANMYGRKAELQQRLTLLVVAEGRDPLTHVFGLPMAPQQPVVQPGQAVLGQQNRLTATATLLDILECPVCFRTVLPPVFHCPNGHSVCNRCRPLITQCPTCRGPPPSVRSVTLERIIDSLWFDCPNQGCTGRIPLRQKNIHEVICPYRP